MTNDNSAGLRSALEAMLHAVCGETGFASAVRGVSGFAYPWPALDAAEEQARATLSATPASSAMEEAVAWRWRGVNMNHWVYDPTPEWVDAHRNDPAVILQPLYASQPQHIGEVKVTDEMLQAAGTELKSYIPGHGWTGFGPTPNMIEAALTAAIPLAPSPRGDR